MRISFIPRPHTPTVAPPAPLSQGVAPAPLPPPPKPSSSGSSLATLVLLCRLYGHGDAPSGAAGPAARSMYRSRRAWYSRAASSTHLDELPPSSFLAFAGAPA